jgi:hypothetical protein
MRMHITHGMKQPIHLPLTCANDSWICMAGRRDAKGGCQIQILPSVSIPNMNPPRTRPNDRPRTVRVHERHVPGLVVAQKFKCLTGCHEARKDPFGRVGVSSLRRAPGLGVAGVARIPRPREVLPSCRSCGSGVTRPTLPSSPAARSPCAAGPGNEPAKHLR